MSTVSKLRMSSNSAFLGKQIFLKPEVSAIDHWSEQCGLNKFTPWILIWSKSPVGMGLDSPCPCWLTSVIKHIHKKSDGWMSLGIWWYISLGKVSFNCNRLNDVMLLFVIPWDDQRATVWMRPVEKSPRRKEDKCMTPPLDFLDPSSLISLSNLSLSLSAPPSLCFPGPLFLDLLSMH